MPSGYPYRALSRDAGSQPIPAIVDLTISWDDCLIGLIGRQRCRVCFCQIWVVACLENEACLCPMYCHVIPSIERFSYNLHSLYVRGKSKCIWRPPADRAKCLRYRRLLHPKSEWRTWRYPPLNRTNRIDAAGRWTVYGQRPSLGGFYWVWFVQRQSVWLYLFQEWFDGLLLWGRSHREGIFWVQSQGSKHLLCFLFYISGPPLISDREVFHDDATLLLVRSHPPPGLSRRTKGWPINNNWMIYNSACTIPALTISWELQYTDHMMALIGAGFGEPTDAQGNGSIAQGL